MKPLFAPVSLEELHHSIRHEGSQKPSSSLSEGVRGVLIINTETGEKPRVAISMTSRNPQDSQSVSGELTLADPLLHLQCKFNLELHLSPLSPHTPRFDREK
jgi:hypothetical protein